jgi:hypothetical protein
VERSTWTDTRLDDRFDHVDSELALLRSAINDLRLVIIRGNWAVIAGLVAVIAAILARGV